MEVVKAETIEPEATWSSLAVEQPETELLVAKSESPIDSKNAIRRSLWASTLDGVFATVFSNITGGVLLSNFLVELDATPTQIGLLASIPMLANLLQPLGAFIGDRVPSRHWYCIWIYVPSRLIWLILVGAIALTQWQQIEPQTLVTWTLAIVFVTNCVGALGSAAWLSWMAALVPRRLRGRYFGIRNSAASLTNLLSVPVMGVAVSAFFSGSVQGFGVVLVLGVIAGMISLGFQSLMVDVNPQIQDAEGEIEEEEARETHSAGLQPSEVKASAEENHFSLPRFPILQDTNFLLFLVYFSLWMFAVNLGAPFFNLYMLDNLSIDVRWVTIYNSLQAGANMLMLIFWGKLADRVGNRSILFGVGILVAVTPLLWVGVGAGSFSIWMWLPLLHILAGVTWAAIDLCNNNLQLGVAPVRHQATYFAVAAAVAGISGALGTTVGGLLAEFADYGGIPSVFALSAAVRLIALLPLVFVHEQRRQSLRHMMRVLFPPRTPVVAIETPSLSTIESRLEDPPK